MRWRIGGALAAWAAALFVAGAALRHPAPLRLEVGAGDDALAAGFADRWDRFESRGRNTYRWTRQEARLTFPAVIDAPAATLVPRLGRFTGETVPVTVSANGRVLAQWLQGTSGWRVERFAMPSLRSSTLTVSFSSSATATEASPAGVALDWLELRDVEHVWPRARGWLGLAFLGLIVPGMLSFRLRTLWPLASIGPSLLVALGLLAWADPAGALTILELAGPRAGVAALLLVLVSAVLCRVWAAARAFERGWILVPVLAALVAASALSYPRYHYPDVETHGRFLAGIRAQPAWALDPREYQLQTRAWTRSIDGRLVGFPYSAAFHVLAWPLAPLLGEVGALKTVAATAVGLSALWLYALARMASASPSVARLAQVLFVLTPVVTSRLTLALWPSLLGQSFDLLVLLALARGAAVPSGLRSPLALAALLALAEASYTGSLLNAGAVVAVLAVATFVTGERRVAGRLVLAWGLATLAVVLVQYRHFLPVFWGEILPRAAGVAAATPSATGSRPSAPLFALERLLIFFGWLLPPLAAWGASRWREAAPLARRVLGASLAAGLLLGLARAGLPAAFSDAKEVELLAGPVALLAAWGLRDLWSRGGPWRALCVAAAGALVAWCLLRAVELYLERLVVMLA